MYLCRSKSHDMKKGTYKTKKQNRSEVREPLGTYSASHNPIVINDSVIPDGYLSLERFGEIFHQKLDTNYENLQSNHKWTVVFHTSGNYVFVDRIIPSKMMIK